MKTEIELTETQWQELEMLAAKRQIHLTDLLSQAINKLLQQAYQEDEERRRKALATVGIFEGPADMARKHDHYLVEANDHP